MIKPGLSSAGPAPRGQAETLAAPPQQPHPVECTPAPCLGRPWGWVRPLRVALGVLVLAAFGLIFTDAWERVPPDVARFLGSTQLIPSLLAWVAGAGLGLAALLILGATWMFGRAYCAVLCPLGLLQDAVWRLRQWIRPCKRLPFAPEATGLRWTVFGLCALGAILTGGLALAWLDPYSLFGRAAAYLLRPLAVWLGNTLTPLLHAVGWSDWYRVESAWHWGMATAVVLVMSIAIVALAAWRGRLYCNTICPVGTLLGWLARRARWRLRLSPGLCRKCGECLEVCKAQCIDLRRQELDFSRCVLCFNCLGICPERGVHFELAWRRRARPSPPVEPATCQGSSRRHFLLLLLALIGWKGWAPSALRAAGTSSRPVSAGVSAPVPEKPPPVSPPGSRRVDRFLRQCTACGLCVTACPTRVLQPADFEYGPAGLMRPRMDYQRAYCNYECRRCGEVCPTGAILPLPLEEKKLTKIGEVVLTLELCVVVAQGTDCVACSEHCPTQAVFPKPYKDHLRVPEINPALCIGCGACEFACPVRPVRAIRVHGWAEHGRAEKWVDTPATPPALGEDFPF